MKKNISINISGIIFHIEEDAYEKLKAYLDSIHRYFESFEESGEIIADIESRIAEIFLSKLNEGKQVITSEDVASLMVTMGSVRDFQAAEEEIKGEPAEEESHTNYDEPFTTGGRRLFRDVNRKILGGVSAGIAYYFKIDPLWIRLLIILLTIGSSGVLIIIYIILWLVLPESRELKEDQKLKKMYRNPQDKVIAGVSGGIAAYFGVDVTVIRLLFIIFAVIGGSGLIAYIILWIILPEAKSLTDRMQMQGDPITLSNIESNIKESLNVKKNEEENILTKIILFPFRLIAVVFQGLGKALGPLILFLVEFIRVVAGLFMVFLGFVMLFATLVGFGALIGLWPAMNMDPVFVGFGDLGIPLEVIQNSFPFLTALAMFFLVAVPSFFVMLLGASIIAKRLVFNTTTGWTMFAAFFVSAIIVSINVPAIVWSFQEEGEHRVETTYDFNQKIPLFTLKEVGGDNYDVTDLKIRGHEGSEFMLVQVFEAQGRSRKEAGENAALVEYNVVQQDSILTFDSNIQFPENAVFRAQRLEMTLYVPRNQPFVMDRSLRYILDNTLYPYGYGVHDLENNKWIFTDDDELKCITCPEENEDEEEPAVNDEENNTEENVPSSDTVETIST